MPTRKQRRCAAKEHRHEYETVWVDSEGNELEEPPDDAPAPVHERRADGKKAPQKRPQQRPTAGTRAPLPPSWRRAVRRSLMLGGAVLVVAAVLAGGGAAWTTTWTVSEPVSCPSSAVSWRT